MLARLDGDTGADAVLMLRLGWSVTVQPHLPSSTLPEEQGPYLAYLDVWDRQVYALEDPLLREVALDGPDTAGRDQVIWQVRLLALQPLIEDGLWPSPPTCVELPSDWSPFGDAGPGRLAARSDPGAGAGNPCAPADTGGLRLFENHLYRFEVHNGGQLGQQRVTGKWSRDNAIHRARLLGIGDDHSLQLDQLGRDDATRFRSGDWLEVLDETRILDRRPGYFARIDVQGTRVAVTELLDPDSLDPLTHDGEPDLDLLPRTGQVRRWEGGPPVEIEPGDWTSLEAGLEVRCEAGALRTGDYWTIPARTIPADIEWPIDPSSGAPLARPPQGIIHRFCPLAVLRREANGWELDQDCRALFPPLTGLDTLLYRGGDGQQVTPNPSAPGALLLGDGNIEIVPFTPALSGRQMTLVVREHRILFDSELPQQLWERLLRTIPTADITSSEMLAVRVRGIAEQLIEDEAFRLGFPAVMAIVDAVEGRTQGIAGQAVVCAGSRLTDVVVSGNRLERVLEGIRVAVSHAGDEDEPPDRIGTVVVSDNHLELALPPSVTQGKQGIYIGNAERVYLTGNLLRFDRAEGERRYLVGAEIWGHYGPLIHLRENCVYEAELALRVTLADDAPAKDSVLWRSVANLAVNADKIGFLYRVDPRRSPSLQVLPFIRQDDRVIDRPSSSPSP